MPIFITQARLSQSYIKSGLAKPEDRQAALSRLCEQAGGRLVSMYFTLGRYDVLVVSDMPDASAAASIVLAACGGGGLSEAVTTQAFTAAQGKELFERASKIGYKPMGGS
jgi:uncharacterized protein with GYD domain